MMGCMFLLGIYVVGDIVDYEGKVKFIVIGFGEVVMVVNNVVVYLNLSVFVFFGYLFDYVLEVGLGFLIM